MEEFPLWLVTDHAETRQSLPQLIRAKGYPLDEIDCGDEVLKRLQFRSPSLVILDCGLPDAFEMLSRIRAEHRSRSIPVLMFCIDDRHLKVEALMRGADGYVPKGSLDWVELLAEIARLAGPPKRSE